MLCVLVHVEKKMFVLYLFFLILYVHIIFHHLHTVVDICAKHQNIIHPDFHNQTLNSLQYTRNSLLLFLAGQKAGRDFIVLSCPPFAPWAMCHRRRRQCRCVCCSPLERWRSKRGCLPQPRSRRNEWYWVVVNVFVHIIFAHGVR